MPQTYRGVTIPAGPDLAYGPKAFSDAVDAGNFVAVFANQAERDAWAAPPEGALAYVRTDKFLYERIGNAWVLATQPPVFATVDARTSAWPSPPAGALSYVTATGQLDFYNGTAWTKVDTAYTPPVVHQATFSVDAATPVTTWTLLPFSNPVHVVGGITLVGGKAIVPVDGHYAMSAQVLIDRPVQDVHLNFKANTGNVANVIQSGGDMRGCANAVAWLPAGGAIELWGYTYPGSILGGSGAESRASVVLL